MLVNALPICFQILFYLKKTILWTTAMWYLFMTIKKGQKVHSYCKNAKIIEWYMKVTYLMVVFVAFI